MGKPVGSNQEENIRNAMNGPLISVIIPTYNYGSLICDALKSVVVQTYPNWECIIVDDGSTDDTAETVKQFIAANPGLAFHYVRKPNGGTAAAKNAGIALAKGAYLQFLDADDRLSPDKMRIQISAISSTRAPLVFSRSVFFMASGGEEKYLDKYPAGYLGSETLEGTTLISKLVRNNQFTISSPLVETLLVKKAGMFLEGLDSNEDWLFWFRIALLKPYFVYDGQKASFSEVRLHAGSAMTSNHKMALGEEVVRTQMHELLFESKPTHYKEIMGLNADLLALHRIRLTKLKTGAGYVLKQFAGNPFKNYILLGKGIIKLAARIFKT